MLGMGAQFDLRFQSNDGESLLFDFFRPERPEAVPLVVCIHGGGWISGDKSMMSEVAAEFAGRGFAAACPSYRLAPLHPYPAAVMDVRAFLRHARAHADELGIDPGRIAAMGNSAGGHLACMAGVADDPREGVSSRADAVIDICGLAQLDEPVENHYPVSFGFLEQFMGCPYPGNEDRWREASPIRHVGPGCPPFLILHGEEDDIVPIGQSEELAGRLFAAGGEVEFHRLPGEGHAFTYEGWKRIEERMDSFLRRVLLGTAVERA